MRLGCLSCFCILWRYKGFFLLVGFGHSRIPARSRATSYDVYIGRELFVPKVSLKSGKSFDVSPGQSVAQALAAGGVAVGPDVLAATINGQSTDLSAALTGDATVEPLRFDSAQGREVYRHSSTHIMAQAVKELFPTAQLTIGPALEDSFYYDFAYDRPFTPEDLEKIEERAREIIETQAPHYQTRIYQARGHRVFQSQGRAL